MSSPLTAEKVMSLPVMEHFYSIQGEGFHQGRAAYFIRLGGCDVGCVWCDVKESWDAQKHPLTSLMQMNDWVAKSNANFVVITGGEPLMYDCSDLTKSFENQEVELAVETSGAYPLSGDWNWVCVSPKKFKAPKNEVLAAANELKVIIFNKSDFDWAEEHAEHVNDDCKLYLQPEWSKEKEMAPLIVDYIQKNPKWNVSVQIHKYLDLR